MDEQKEPETLADKGPVPDQEAPSQSSTTMADVPDPDEDELDDLDDMLDEFSATKIGPSNPPASSGPGRPQESGAVPETNPAPQIPPSGAGGDDSAFAQQLQDGMADLLGELETSPELQQQFETFMKDFGQAAAAGGDGPLPGLAPPAGTAASGPAPPAAGSSSSPGPTVPPTSTSTKSPTPKPPPGEDNFQETIRRTMQRMQDSGAQASAAAASGEETGADDDILAEMLKQMSQNGDLGGAGGEEDFSKMLLGMMEQLTNKEILYDPMKELHDKFPAWLAENGEKIPEADRKRYEEQESLVREIVQRFERPGYSDDNTADREFIVERMQKMQAAGSPPADLVGNMSAAQEAFGGLDGGDEGDAGCPQQ